MHRIATLLLALTLATGCSDRDPAGLDAGVDADSGRRDGQPAQDVGYIPDLMALPDGFGPLAPCSAPGKPCKANDPCAINPICGADKLCHPLGIQNCDDGLACTVDHCMGLGMCESLPADGTCALVDSSGSTIQVKCFKDGDKRADNPCMVCDSATDKYSWSPANGGGCDDGDSCTKDDYCQDGSCKGTAYGVLCSDSLACTTDACDGMGGCLGNTLVSGWCLINGACYKDGENDPVGTCNTCDVSGSVSAWTPIVDACEIPTGPTPPPPPPPFPPPPPLPTTCYANGDPHPSGSCAKCDTQASKSSWTVQSGYCLIMDTCYASGAGDPFLSCTVCDPQKDPLDWSQKPGTCFIMGQCFNSGATTPDGCGTCDPQKDPTGWTPVPNTCLIDGNCWKSGDLHPGGCAQCVPATSATSWTVVGSTCLINNTCYKPNDTSTNGCGLCDPTKSKTAWTPKPNTCLIGDTCYKDGDLHSSGCLTCDHAKNPGAWTPVAGVSTATHDFESGAATGWTLQNTDASVGWVVSNKRAASGSYALYYGDPATGHFDSGGTNSGTAAMPAVTLTAGKKAALSFQLWMDTESGSSYDQLKVYVGSTVVWEKGKTQQVPIKQWLGVDVDLSTYAGQSVTIKLEFNTVDGVSNTTEGVYIDDVTLYHGC